jgi:hypothetical protein
MTAICVLLALLGVPAATWTIHALHGLNRHAKQTLSPVLLGRAEDTAWQEIVHDLRSAR